MSADPMQIILDILRGTALLQESNEQSDGRLLTRFVENRDALALQMLVRRHAPMVWSVCRRNLTHHIDAEDAFQATFLVFLRKAASIRSRELLANWLYGVAYQTSRKARQAATKLPVPLPTSELPTAEPHNAFEPELLTQLELELSRLPEKYRNVIVLCHLEGKSLRDAAQRLGVAEGTIGSRLTRGRAILARRVARSGATVSAISVGTALNELAASASVPVAVSAHTIQVVGQLAAGEAIADGLLSAGASALAQGMLRSLTVAKNKTMAVWLLMAALVLASGAAAYYSLAEQGTVKVEPPELAAQTPKQEPQPPRGKGPEEPDPNKHGTAADAQKSARNYLQDHLFTLPALMWPEHNGDLPVVSDGGVFGYWPSRDIAATFDPATHQWALTGTCRYDMPEFYKDGTFDPDARKEFDCRETQWKLVLAYNPSTRAYQVQRAEFPDRKPFGWRSTSKEDFARWLLGEYPEPRPSSDSITTLHLNVEAPEPTKLGLKPENTYGMKDLTIEAPPRNSSRWPSMAAPTIRNNSVGLLSVRIEHGTGGHGEQWDLQFGAPEKQFLKVAKYGGAYDPKQLRGSLGPLLVVKHCVLDAGKQASEWSCGPGEFVVREIEVKEKKVVRLAIDFIADNEYGRPAGAKPDTRHIVRGSLRWNSLLQPSVPELGAGAAGSKLTDPAPAGLRGMKFVPLPKGTFYRGWNGTKGSAKKTEIKDDFEIAVYTVTQGQWQELMWNNPSWFSRQGGGKEAVKDITDEDLKKFPVESVSWNDVQVFIKRLNEREKGKGYVYRLPTHAEWEYACRGGATTEEECSYHFYFEKPTNDLSSKQANFDGRNPFGKGDKGPYLGRTTKVGSYAPNKLGLYDMHGNVWQGTNHSDDGGSDWRVRGGGWNSVAGSCRAVCRSVYPFPGGQPNYSSPECIGFRLVRVRVR